MVWSKERCEEGILAPDLNNAIRDQYSDLEAALTKDMHFSTGETPDSQQGIFRQGSCRCYFQAAAPTTRTNGDAFTSIDNGSLWVDSDDNTLYMLTDYSVPTWTSIFAVFLAGTQTFADVITFSKSPVFTLGIVGNDAYLQARNNADDGNVDLIKAGTHDELILGSGINYVAQIVNTQTGAASTGTTLVPADDTIPQNDEGDEYMTLAITPTLATNKLKIEVVAQVSASTTAWLIASLFQDSTANALASMIVREPTALGPFQILFTHYMTAGTTSETTFKVRIGPHVVCTVTFNGQNSARKCGGVMASSITITEFKA